MTNFRARALTVIPLALLIVGAATFTVATVHIRQAEASVRNIALPPLAPLSDMRIPAVAYPAYVPDAAVALTKVRMGARFGSIWLPRFKEHWAIVEGTRLSDLRLGVGHVVNTALPGALSNTVLAGHRETVFTHLGDLVVGDRVVLRTNAGQFTYQVVGTRIVSPTTVSVLAPSTTARLTMITCYPFVHYGPSPKRYIVTARLLSADPAARTGA
jgi:sortase A